MNCPGNAQAAAAWGVRPAPRVIAQSSRRLASPPPRLTRHIVQAVLLAVQDGLGRLEAAAYCGTDPLRHVSSGESGGIADDEGIPATCHIHVASQVVAVTGGVVTRALGEPAAEHAREERPVVMDGAAAGLDAFRHAADAHIEPA